MWEVTCAQQTMSANAVQKLLSHFHLFAEHMFRICKHRLLLNDNELNFYKRPFLRVKLKTHLCFEVIE